MKCKHCGAQIDDNILLCPYCDCENEKVAKKEQDAHVEYYDKKTEELKKIPDKIVNKSTQYTLVLIGVGIFIFLIAMVIVFVVSNVRAKTSLSTQEKHLMKLEEYYEDGNYEQMKEYLSEKKLYGGSYEKYSLADELCSSYERHSEWLKNYYDHAPNTDIGVGNLGNLFSSMFERLAEVKVFRERGFRYGEEKVVLYVEEGYKKALKEYAFLTDEEIAQAVEEYSNMTDYTELAKKAKKRMETR